MFYSKLESPTNPVLPSFNVAPNMVTERCRDSSPQCFLQSPTVTTKPSTSYAISPCLNNVPDRPDPTPGYGSRRSKSSTDLHTVPHFDMGDGKHGESNLDILVESKFDYQPEASDELKLKPGSTIRLLQRDEQSEDGWWFGETEDGRKGFFPQNYVKLKFSEPREICMEDLKFGGILGSGGCCVVKSAFYKGKPVAVKIPHTKFSQDELLKTVKEEAGIFRQLSHKNILKMFGVIAGSEPGLVLELCKDSLASLCSKKRNIAIPSEILYIFGAQITCGMSYLHGLNIIHRDLKAANILIKERVCECYLDESRETDSFCDEFQSNGLCPNCGGAALSRLTLKIADLGLCKKLQFRDDCRMSVAGTLPYLPPEVVREQRCSKAMDIWGFGLVMWEVMTGLTPYQGCGRGFIAIQIGEFYKQTIPANCPKYLKGIIEDCWKNRPEERPSFARLFRRFESLCQKYHFAGNHEKQVTNHELLVEKMRIQRMYEELAARQKKLTEEEIELQMRKIAFAYQTEPKVKPHPPKKKRKPKPSDISEPKDFVQKVSLTPKNVIKSKSRDELKSASTPDRPEPEFEGLDYAHFTDQLKDKDLLPFGFFTLPRTPKKLALDSHFDFASSLSKIPQNNPSKSTPDLSQLYTLMNTSQKSLNTEEASPKLHRTNAKRLKKDSGRSSTDCKEPIDGSYVEVLNDSVTDIDLTDQERHSKALEYLATPKRNSQPRSSSVGNNNSSKASSGKHFLKKLFAKKDKSPNSGTESRSKQKLNLMIHPRSSLGSVLIAHKSSPVDQKAANLVKWQIRKKSKASAAENDDIITTEKSITFVKSEKQSGLSTPIAPNLRTSSKRYESQSSVESFGTSMLDEVITPAGKRVVENTSYVPPNAMNSKLVSSNPLYTPISASQSPSSSSASWDDTIPCPSYIVSNPMYNRMPKAKQCSPDSPVFLDTDITGGFGNDDEEGSENNFSKSRGSEPGVSYGNLASKFNTCTRLSSSECELYVSLKDIQQNRPANTPRRDGAYQTHGIQKSDVSSQLPRKGPAVKQYLNFNSKPLVPSGDPASVSTLNLQRPITLNLRKPSTPASNSIGTTSSSCQSFLALNSSSSPPAELAPRPAPPIPPRSLPRKSEEDIASRQRLSPVSQSP